MVAEFNTERAIGHAVLDLLDEDEDYADALMIPAPKDRVLTSSEQSRLAVVVRGVRAIITSGPTLIPEPPLEPAEDARDMVNLALLAVISTLIVQGVIVMPEEDMPVHWVEPA